MGFEVGGVSNVGYSFVYFVVGVVKKVICEKFVLRINNCWFEFSSLFGFNICFNSRINGVFLR